MIQEEMSVLRRMEKAIPSAMNTLGAAVASAAIYYGAGTAASAIGTAAVVGTYAVAGGVAAAGANRAVETATGKNVIADTVFKGNKAAYNKAETAVVTAAFTVVSLGSVYGSSSSSTKSKDTTASKTTKTSTTTSTNTSTNTNSTNTTTTTKINTNTSTSISTKSSSTVTPSKNVTKGSTVTSGKSVTVQDRGEGKSVPNPSGKKGGLAHQQEIKNIQKDIKSKDLKPVTEYKYNTPGGTKSTRYADVVAVDKKGKVVEVHQVGKVNKNGTPVSREVKAINDIKGAKNYNGAPIIYHPYN